MSAREPPSREGRLEGAAALALFLFGVGLCLHHGRVGLMPLDQSIVFDGAWRILGGQLPYRDFDTPAGIVPMALQALLFRAFGVSWLVYCLHAAIFNGLFAVLVFRLLRLLGSGRGAAAFYGLLSAVVFYPPFGVPYMDQHAFFFSLAVVVAVAEAWTAPEEARRWRALSLGAMPWLLAAACLSKAIPTLLLLPLAFVPFSIARREVSAGRALVVSSAALAAVVAAAVLAVDRALLVESVLTRPGIEERRRLVAMLLPAAFWGQARELLRAAAMPSVLIVVGGAIVMLVWHAGPAEVPHPLPRWCRPVLALGLLAACAAFVMMTDNQGENGIPFVFLAAGLVHSEARARRTASRGLAAAFAATLAAASLVDAIRFEQRVNETRMVHELDGVATAPAAETQALPAELTFLEWRLHPFYRYRPRDLAAVVSLLRVEKGGIYVFGDLTILYALTGRPSAGPTLWLHPGLTLPERSEASLGAWEERLLDDLRRRRVRFVVRESRQTYTGLRLSDLPRVAAFVEAHRQRRFSFGPIDLIELGP